jgi:hypothetical protein
MTHPFSTQHSYSIQLEQTCLQSDVGLREVGVDDNVLLRKEVVTTYEFLLYLAQGHLRLYLLLAQQGLAFQTYPQSI